MKKYVFLIAGLSAASTLAHDRDPAAIGNRLGDGAFMKATGLSPVEWAAMCNDHNQTASGAPAQSYSETQSSMPERNLRDESHKGVYDRDAASIGNRLGDGAFMKATGLSPAEWTAMSHNGVAPPARSYGYSETERLMPDQTPTSTETFQGESYTIASSANTDASVSAGPSKDANFSATSNDSIPAETLTDNHLDIGSDVFQSYNKDHSPIYTDRSDFSGLGVPATSERGTGSSSSAVVPPIDEQLSSSVSSDLEWASQLKSQLTRETPDNTSGQSLTAENLRDVNIRRSNGTVMLTGSVPTESMKRDLEEKVRRLSGVSSINNQLRVAPSADIPANPTRDDIGIGVPPSPRQ